MKTTRNKLAIVGSLGWLVCLLAVPHLYAASSVRTVRLLNDGWKFTPGPREEAEWQSVAIPHTWNVDDTLDDNPGYRRGVSWYRRALKIDGRVPDKRIFLHFEGVGQVAEVFVNNSMVGKHIGGYTAFSWDIAPLLRPRATNLIEVKVDNSLVPDNPPIDGDFNMYGGIYRDVWLITTDTAHLARKHDTLNGIAISTPEVSAENASVDIAGGVVNSSQFARNLEITSSLLDPSGRTVATASSTLQLKAEAAGEFKHATIQVERPALWSPDAPILYTVRTTVREMGRSIDEVTNPLGFRWFKFDPANGFFLNGKHTKLRGTNRHQDHAGMGNAVPDRLHIRDLEIIKENGFNFVRLAHYPQDPAVLAAADRLGLMIWEEIPIVNKITASEAFSENAKTMLREMIRQHRNHPSIIIWGYMNEVFLANPKPDEQIKATVRLARELESICRTEDPHRVTAIAFDRGGTNDLYTSSGLADVTHVIGWNLYHGWYYERFEDFGKFLDDQHRKFPARSLIVSEYGANADTSVHSLTPKRFDSSIEWQQMYHESYLSQIESRPFVAGSAIWNQFDFGSEFRGETMPHINQKGMYRYDRRPKDVSYLYRASYSPAPVVHIAVRDWLKRSGPRTHAVKVYTNLERVELFNNGVSLGTAEIGSDRIGSWQVPFAVGRNALRAVGRADSKTISDQIVVDFHDQASTRTIAVNCGANTEVMDDSGLVWQADTDAVGTRSWSVTGSDSKSVDTRVNILKTPDDAIYQTMREGASAYKFDVPDGPYEIELRFAEPRLKASGERVFKIMINGLPLSEMIDVFAEAGYMTGLTRRTTQTAAGGRGIRIELIPIKGLPIISGIRLKRIN